MIFKVIIISTLKSRNKEVSQFYVVLIIFSVNKYVINYFFNKTIFRDRLGGGEKRKPSISSEMRMPAESDTESIADYADGNDAGIYHLVKSFVIIN